MEKFKLWLPVISPIIAVLSFFAGTMVSAANIFQTTEATRVAKVEAQASQWQQSLQKVSFSEDDLIITAFLMQNFEDDEQYGSSARQIERTVLQRAKQPETFDVVYSNMLSNLKTTDQVNETIDIGRQIDSRLYALWQAASKGQLAGGEPKTFEYFLQKPDRFYSPDTEQAQLNQVFVLMWQLDTFSQGMACVWGATDGACPHPPLKGLKVNKLFVLNSAVPTGIAGSEAPKTYTTCVVHRDETQVGFRCDNNVADDWD
jgi:hypothetical protein